SVHCLVLFIIILLHLRSSLFPYTTLFRSYHFVIANFVANYLLYTKKAVHTRWYKSHHLLSPFVALHDHLDLDLTEQDVPYYLSDSFVFVDQWHATLLL